MNLSMLGYYKYTEFFLSNTAVLLRTEFIIPKIVLPLGISFFTFTQIAYLIDSYNGKVKSFNFIHYSLFVTYFPHLIAGPILHHKKMIEQFTDTKTQILWAENITIGLSYFTIGLGKKVLIADTFAKYADPIYESVNTGTSPTFFLAWLGAIAFSFQIYFDFSAYSDMAIGIARMLGVELPINFNSPYKAKNISDFWRRWHISLSNFLRDYLYIPLGGNRKGQVRRYSNLMVTMLLGGLWHGANVTFILWGGLHGFFLTVNHIYRGTKKGAKNLKLQRKFPKTINIISVGITFLSVAVSWVIFRSATLASAFEMLKGMSGLNGISFPYSASAYKQSPVLSLINPQFNGMFPGFEGIEIIKLSLELLLVSIIVWGFPNSQEILSTQNLRKLSFKRITIFGILLGLIFTASISSLFHVLPFIYFQF
jgi:alginate O-acetyltransferase complex protein AlgI